MEADFGGHLDYLIDEMCWMNTRVGRIAHRQARMAGFAPSPSLERLTASLPLLLWMMRTMLALPVMTR